MSVNNLPENKLTPQTRVQTLDGGAGLFLPPSLTVLQYELLTHEDKGSKEADEFVRMVVGAQPVHTRVGVVRACTGAEMGSLFEMWSRQGERLAQPSTRRATRRLSYFGREAGGG